MRVSKGNTEGLLLQRSRGSRTVTTAQKKLNVAINGFGRIGRNFLRCVEGRENSLLNIVVINDSGESSRLSPCHVLDLEKTQTTENDVHTCF